MRLSSFLRSSPFLVVFILEGGWLSAFQTMSMAFLRQVGRQAVGQPDSQTDRWTGRQTDKKTGKKVDSVAVMQAGRRVGR